MVDVVLDHAVKKHVQSRTILRYRFIQTTLVEAADDIHQFLLALRQTI